MIIVNKLTPYKRMKIFIIFILFFSLFNISGIAFAEDDLDYVKLDTQNQDLRNFNSNKYFNNFLEIPLKTLLEVIRTDQEGLKRNLLISGALLGIIHFLDQNIRNYVQDNLYVGDTNLSEFLYSSADLENMLVLYSGSLLWSKIINDSYLKNTSYYSFQALLITQAFTELLKNTINRDRPRNSKNNPLSRTGGKSFISGHASGTWATMTIFAKRYPKTKYLSYGFASLVSVSRIYDDAHWFSDVLAGSIVGYGVGSLTLNLNDALPENVFLEPLISHEITGVALNFRF